MTSKTQQAVDWIAEDPTRTAYQAAQRFGINRNGISLRLRQIAAGERCKCCGHILIPNATTPSRLDAPAEPRK